MISIRKAVFAASALAITLVGATFVTAPMAFARPAPIAAHQASATPAGAAAASAPLKMTVQ